MDNQYLKYQVCKLDNQYLKYQVCKLDSQYLKYQVCKLDNQYLKYQVCKLDNQYQKYQVCKLDNQYLKYQVCKLDNNYLKIYQESNFINLYSYLKSHFWKLKTIHFLAFFFAKFLKINFRGEFSLFSITSISLIKQPL